MVERKEYPLSRVIWFSMDISMTNFCCYLTIPVDGWIATDLVVFNRQLGRGVVRGVTRFRFPPDRPGIFISETHEVYSFN